MTWEFLLQRHFASTNTETLWRDVAAKTFVSFTLDILSSIHLAHQTFCQTDILSTWHYDHWTFCSTDILLAWHFVPHTSCPPDILPTGHFTQTYFWTSDMLPSWFLPSDFLLAKYQDILRHKIWWAKWK